MGIEWVMSDNAFAYRHGRASTDAVAQLVAVQKLIRPHCPWQNGKVERFNRTLRTEWAYRHIFTSNQARPTPLPPGCTPTTLNAATALADTPDHPSVTSLMAECIWEPRW